MPAPDPFYLGRIRVQSGERKDIRIKVSEQTLASPVHIPVTVLNGAHRGPKIFVTAAIHGDELNGVEIVRRVRQRVDPRRLRGTLIMVAIANPIGFMHQERGLPDGRDLNRCFPGRRRGSIGRVIAHEIFEKVVRQCDGGIDLHTAGRGRVNMPHLRADMGRRDVRALAEAFGAGVTLDIRAEKGSLRQAGRAEKIPVVTYEAGEPLRFERTVIERGVRGILNIVSGRKRARKEGLVLRRHRWIRARRGGILVLNVEPGDRVRRSQVLGFTSRPLGTRQSDLVAPFDGIVLSTAVIPSVHPGSAVCHLSPLNGGRRD